MSYTTILSRTDNTCRKAARCVWCNEVIEVGTPYTRQVGVYEGDFFTQKFHPECEAASTRFFAENPTEDGFDPGEFKRGSTESR